MQIIVCEVKVENGMAKGGRKATSWRRNPFDFRHAIFPFMLRVLRERLGAGGSQRARPTRRAMPAQSVDAGPTAAA